MSLLDLDLLLQPIPGEAPAGPSLRYDPVFDALRELRREDDALAPRGVWRSRLKLADWPAVIAQTQSALATRSKDLQLAAWLAEALAVRHGLAGTTAGLALLAGLAGRYWPLLWPAAGEDAEEDARLTVLEWLDGKLAERLMLQPMAEAGEPPPSWHDQASLQRRRAGTQGRPTAEDGERQAALTKAIARTPDATYLRMLAELRQAAAGLAALLATLRQAGTESPPAFAQLRATFATMEAFLRSELTGRRLPIDQPAPAVVAMVEPPAGEAPPSPALPPGGAIASRDAAYQRLEEVAQYLEALEPHSPVPALLRRAIGWGRMQLPELLAELMKEEGGPFRLLRIAPARD
jgi:type VI secretion system ImpA family protein